MFLRMFRDKTCTDTKRETAVMSPHETSSPRLILSSGPGIAALGVSRDVGWGSGRFELADFDMIEWLRVKGQVKKNNFVTFEPFLDHDDRSIKGAHERISFLSIQWKT